MSTEEGDEFTEGFDMLFAISSSPDGELTGRIYRGERQMEQVKPIVQQIDDAMRDPRFRRRMTNFRRSVRLGNPSFAVGDAPFPQNATVAVIRDPATTPHRLIVVRRGAPESEVSLGRSTLRQSEIAQPEITMRTIILRWVDGRYAIMHDGCIRRSGSAAWRYLGSDQLSIDTRPAAGDHATHLQVPELGLVHLIV